MSVRAQLTGFWIAGRAGALLALVLMLALIWPVVAQAAPQFSWLGEGGHEGEVITTGPDGAMWMLDGGNGLTFTHPALVRLSIHGKVDAFRLSHSDGFFSDLVVGGDGNLWYTDTLTKPGTQESVVVRAKLNGRVTAFPFGRLPSSYLTGLTMGPRDQLWFTGVSRYRQTIGSLSLRGKRISAVARHGPGDLESAITEGADGNLWTATGFKLTPSGRLTRYPGSFDSSAIVSGADRNLWISDAGSVDRLTLTGQFMKFPYGPDDNGQVLSMTAGPDGNIWFVKSQTAMGDVTEDDAVGVIDPSGHSTLYPLAQGTDPLWITAGPDGALWIPTGTDRILHITPEQPPAGWPAAATPGVTSIRATHGTVRVKLSCRGIPGLFCDGVLQVRLSSGRRHFEMRRIAVLAASGQRLTLALKRPGLKALSGASASVTADFDTTDFLLRNGHAVLRRRITL